MNYEKKVKAISTKVLTKDFINEYNILKSQKYFFQEYLKIIQYLYQIKHTLNVLLAIIKFICGSIMECQKEVLKI